jgi:hypothetical protein
MGHSVVNLPLRPIAVALFAVAIGCGARTQLLDETGEEPGGTSEDAALAYDSGPPGCFLLAVGRDGGGDCQWSRGTSGCHPAYTEGACPSHLGDGALIGCCISTYPEYEAAICNYYPYSAVTKAECLMDDPTSNTWQTSPP